MRLSNQNLMVHLEPGRSNAELLAIASEIASRLQAGVTGIAACQPMQVAYGEGYVDAESIDIDQLRMAALLRDAEAEFRDAMQGQTGALDWRTSVSARPIAQYVASQSASADLVLTGAGIGGIEMPSRRADTSDLVMLAGRPVLLVPAGVVSLPLQTAVVFWKDSRESRRALHDALPLLRLASRVVLVSVVREDRRPAQQPQMALVKAWLQHHDVESELMLLAAAGDEVTQLQGIAAEQEADVIVAGAYGHGRLQEWALGGVTRDLLLQADRCALLSH